MAQNCVVLRPLSYLKFRVAELYKAHVSEMYFNELQCDVSKEGIKAG